MEMLHSSLHFSYDICTKERQKEIFLAEGDDKSFMNAPENGDDCLTLTRVSASGIPFVLRLDLDSLSAPIIREKPPFITKGFYFRNVRITYNKQCEHYDNN